MSSSSNKPQTIERRIDLLFSKFAAFYGHVWRSQFKDEVFLKFAKKEWQDALGDFTDENLAKAITTCRNFYELPPTLPQMIQCCKQIKKELTVNVVKHYVPASKAVVEACLRQCKQSLSR